MSIKRVVYIIGFLLLLSMPMAFAQPLVPVLCYHDVSDTVGDYKISAKNLREHFLYLREAGFTPISLKQYEEALLGRSCLPEKPILLTFDDGYSSFYTTVLPLLEEFRYPAILALITSWIDDTGGQGLTSEQLRQIHDSGFVAIASHTDQLHKYVKINAAGDEAPWTNARPFVNGHVISLAEYRQGIHLDLKRSRQKITRLTNDSVEAIVWPYGATTEDNIDIAMQEGYHISFLFAAKANDLVKKDWRHVRRQVIPGDLDAKGLAALISSSLH